jgi:glutathione synthase/RimK-type ligase-like ATP-grasp enzyme
LLEALRAAGVDAFLSGWDCPAVDWSLPEPTLLRTTWNYYRRTADFLAWAERVSSVAPMWNDLDVVRDTIDKHYLAHAEARGVRIVPTEFVAHDRAADVDEVLRARGWDDVVIKPAVSAASFGTRRFSLGEHAAARAHVDALRAEGRDVMIQPYVKAIDGHGERSVVFIDGVITHAIRKNPRFSEGVERVDGPFPVSAAESETTLAALAPWRERLLYGRVDLVPDDEGRPMVMEIELIEPSLFLLQEPRALDRLVAGILRRLRQGHPRSR